MRHCAFIYNPAAGHNKSDAKFGVLKKKIAKKPGCEIFTSESQEHIGDLIQQLSTDFDVFVACGGDGTVREVAKGVINCDAAMGIIPMGNGNDLCKTLKIPTAVEDAFELIFNGEQQEIDVGYCNDFIFLNTLGFGFDGLANRYVHKMPDTTFSTWNYMRSALKANIYREFFRVKINQEDKTKLMMLTLANGRVEGGKFWIAPNASITDGQLEMVQVRPVSKWILPFLLPFFLFKKISWIPYLDTTKINSLDLEFEKEVEIHADGEIIKNDIKTFSISMHDNKLPMICNL